VVDMNAVRPVTDDLDKNEENTIINEIANALNISSANVTISVKYVTNGVIQLNVSDTTNITQVENEIEEILAEELNIHPSNIEVVYNETSGEITYTISMDTYEVLNLKKRFYFFDEVLKLTHG
jgi:3'-phosphoadenosine 5'-phosphosulfate (PAPS) 3'-phosphatase